MKKLTDQQVLAKMALGEEQPFIREAAVERLTDQRVLAKLARKDESYSVREAAKTRLAKLKRINTNEKF